MRLCTSCEDIGLSLSVSAPVRVGSRRIPGVNVNGTLPNVAQLQNLDLYLQDARAVGDRWQRA